MLLYLFGRVIILYKMRVCDLMQKVVLVERIGIMLLQSSQKRSPAQIAGIVVIVVLTLLIVFTFAIFGLFSKADSAPKIFGSRIYVVNNDRMEPRIPKGAAVFVKEGTLPEDNKVILCSIDDHLWVLGYVGMETAEDGSLRYLVKYDNATDDKTWGIAQSDIIGVAQTYDMFIGSVIRFASSKSGMLVIVIVPCIVIIAYEIIMLIISNRRPRKPLSKDSEKAVKKPADRKSADRAPEPPVRRVGGGPDPEDVIPDRKDIQAPIDIASEEKFVEKQLKRATNKLSNVVMAESTISSTAPEEISLDPIIGVDPILSAPIQQKPAPSWNTPAQTEQPAHSTPVQSAPTTHPVQTAQPTQPAPASASPLGELSAARIDELIKLLEEEKKRLGQ